MKNNENKRVRGGILLSFFSLMLASVCIAGMFIVCYSVTNSNESIISMYKKHDYYQSKAAVLDAYYGLHFASVQSDVTAVGISYLDKDGNVISGVNDRNKDDSFNIVACIDVASSTVKFLIKDKLVDEDKTLSEGVYINENDITDAVAGTIAKAPEGTATINVSLYREYSSYYDYTLKTVVLFVFPVLFVLAAALFIIGACRRGKSEKYRLISQKFTSHIFFEIKWAVTFLFIAGLIYSLSLVFELFSYVYVYDVSDALVVIVFAFFACGTVYNIKLVYYDIKTLGVGNYFKRTFFYWLFKAFSSGKNDEKCVKKLRTYFILYLSLAALLCFFTFVGISAPLLFIISILLLLIVTVVFLVLILDALKDFDLFAKKLFTVAKSGDASEIHLPKVSDMYPLDKALDTLDVGYREAAERSLKDEKTKVELITNVSHDLKTPLTSIISYTDLLSGLDDLSPQEAKDYVLVLEEKTQKLKKLIEDLFELSKATTGNIEITTEDIDFGTLIKQALSYNGDAIAASQLSFDVSVPEHPAPVSVDGSKLHQVLDNLIGNALKYSMPGSRVYVKLTTDGGLATLEMKNISALKLDIDPSQLTERFVRGDESRTTDGSGLGLAIAKTYTELCGGQFKITIDGDLFKVFVTFSISEQPPVQAGE